MTTPREEADINAAIADAQKEHQKRGTSLYDSAITMAELYVEIKEMGVREEDILDLIRIPFMFAAVPNKPEMVTESLGDIDAKRKDH